jgi:hypothetical protein
MTKFSAMGRVQPGVVISTQLKQGENCSTLGLNNPVNSAEFNPGVENASCNWLQVFHVDR